MHLTLTTNDDMHAGRLDGKRLCVVPETLFSSMKALRFFLATHAARTWGGVEGKDWSIRNYPERSSICPIYASRMDGLEVLEIK